MDDKQNGYTKIPNELLEKLCHTRINGEARQMLDVIIRKTIGFQKKQDKIPTSQFTKLTNLHPQAIHKARKKLLDMKIITVTQKGNSQVQIYSLRMDYKKWQLLPKKVTVTQKGKGVLPKKVTASSKETIQKKDKEVIHKEKYPVETYQEIISYLNKKTGKKFSAVAGPTKEMINGRLDDGATVDDFKKVIDNKVNDWGDGKNGMFQYLRPSTLFSVGHFEEYLNEGGGNGNQNKFNSVGGIRPTEGKYAGLTKKV